MNDFVYKNGVLYCEDLRLSDIARKVGTPFYLYSKNTLISHYHAVDQAFAQVPHIICFSAKANSNVAILNLLAREGSGADVVSGGELYRALKANVDPQKIVYAGIGKTEPEIRAALRSAGVNLSDDENEDHVTAGVKRRGYESFASFVRENQLQSLRDQAQQLGVTRRALSQIYDAYRDFVAEQHSNRRHA